MPVPPNYKAFNNKELLAEELSETSWLLLSEYNVNIFEQLLNKNHAQQQEFLKQVHQKELASLLQRALELHHLINKEKDLMAKQLAEEAAQANERADITKKGQPLIFKTISFIATMGKIFQGIVAPLFLTLAKTILSPLDYFSKGILALRDAATVQKEDKNRHLRIGTALLITAGLFTCTGLATALTLQLLAGLAVTAATIAIAPIAMAVILVTVASIGFYKEQQILKTMQQTAEQDKNKIIALHKQIKELEDHPSKENQHRIQICHYQIEQLERKMKTHSDSVSYQGRRRNTSMMVLGGFIISAFGLLFPPLLIAGVGLVLLAAGIDAIDKYKQRQKLAAEKSIPLSPIKKSASGPSKKGEDELKILDRLTHHNREAEKHALQSLTKDQLYETKEKPAKPEEKFFVVNPPNVNQNEKREDGDGEHPHIK